MRLPFEAFKRAEIGIFALSVILDCCNIGRTDVKAARTKEEVIDRCQLA